MPGRRQHRHSLSVESITPPASPPSTPVQVPRPVVIGIAGGSGSGKTTVANIVRDRVGHEHISYLPHDAYYKDLGHLPPEKRKEVNFDHPDSIETDLLVKHIEMLLRGRPVEIPVYDFTTHSRVKDQTVHVEPRRIILVEGILIFSDPRICHACDIKIFVDADPDVRFIRRMTRDIHERGRAPDGVAEQWMKTVRPMHLQYVEPSKRCANIVINDGGHNVVAVDMVVDRIRCLLASPKENVSKCCYGDGGSAQKQENVELECH